MAFTTVYAFNIQKDASLVAEKQWKVTVLRLPSSSASGPTAPGTVTTGPLGSTGSAAATYNHGDGTAAGYASPLDAVTQALAYLEDDRALNGDT